MKKDKSIVEILVDYICDEMREPLEFMLSILPDDLDDEGDDDDE